jgi:hypothetical protein
MQKKITILQEFEEELEAQAKKLIEFEGIRP